MSYKILNNTNRNYIILSKNYYFHNRIIKKNIHLEHYIEVKQNKKIDIKYNIIKMYKINNTKKSSDNSKYKNEVYIYQNKIYQSKSDNSFNLKRNY